MSKSPPCGKRVWGALSRGVFPHQLSWLLDNPLRRFLLSPDDLAGRLGLSESSRVLEVGPGSGYFSAALATRIPRGELALLDLQPEMLAKARRKLESMGFHNVRYTRADASGEFPYPDGHFDVAVLVSVLGEISDQPGCLRSLRRVLRPRGLLAVHESIPDPDRIKFEALAALVQAEGFTFVRRWGPSWNYTAAFERANQDAVQQVRASDSESSASRSP